MIQVRLKEIYETSFARSEMTNYRLWRKETTRSLAAGEALCIVSKTGNQMVFVWKPKLITYGGSNAEAFLSVRIRLDSTKWWDGRMLRNYANQVGLELVGLKRYEQYYAKAA